jgi:hypothetical protein
VPVPATVIALTDVLAESVYVPRARAKQVIGGDRVGHFLKRGEPTGIFRHEVTDAINTLLLQLDDDVDEYEPSCHMRVFSGDKQGRRTAQGRTD